MSLSLLTLQVGLNRSESLGGQGSNLVVCNPPSGLQVLIYPLQVGFLPLQVEGGNGCGLEGSMVMNGCFLVLKGVGGVSLPFDPPSWAKSP